MMMEDDREALILDIGSGTIKAGFSNDDIPKCIIPTVIGERKDKDESNNNYVYG